MGQELATERKKHAQKARVLKLRAQYTLDGAHWTRKNKPNPSTAKNQNKNESQQTTTGETLSVNNQQLIKTQEGELLMKGSWKGTRKNGKTKGSRGVGRYAGKRNNKKTKCPHHQNKTKNKKLHRQYRDQNYNEKKIKR